MTLSQNVFPDTVLGVDYWYQMIPDDITPGEVKELLLALPDHPSWWYLVNPNVIPKVIEPMGRYWHQPDPAEIVATDSFAAMGEETFKALADYSYSQPTGCYLGKMWKAHYKDGWWLKWFGYSEKGPEWCSTYSRKIVIL